MFDVPSRKYFVSDKYNKVGNRVIHRESGCKFYLPKAEKLLKYHRVVSSLVEVLSKGEDRIVAGEYYILLGDKLQKVYLMRDDGAYRISPEYYPVAAEAVDKLSTFELSDRIKTLWGWEKELGKVKTGQLITGSDKPVRLISVQDEMGGVFDILVDLFTGKVVYEEESQYLPVYSWESRIPYEEGQKILERASKSGS